MRPGVAPFAPHGEQRRQGPWAAVPRIGAALLALALGVAALSGCGGASAASESAGARQVSTAKDPRDGEPAAANAPRCPASLLAFAAGLEKLRHRLVAGLTYAEYVSAVKRLRGSYAAIAVDRLSPACLVATGTPAERAFDVYIEAANTWGDCLSEAGCDAGDVEAPLQAEWKAASRQLDALRLR